jgi:hypothetical protein
VIVATAYKCLPGWCIVERAETEDTYAGSAIIIPDYVRARVARDQFEIVALPERGRYCDDPDCEVLHVEHHHVLPTTLAVGSWVILGPRSLVEIPGETSKWLTTLEDIWCRLDA